MKNYFNIMAHEPGSAEWQVAYICTYYIKELMKTDSKHIFTMQKFMIFGELRFAKAMKTIDDFTYTKIVKLVYMIERKKIYYVWNN